MAKTDAGGGGGETANQERGGDDKPNPSEYE